MSNEQTHTERANIGVVGLAVMGPTSYDYDWPPAINWELDRLAQEVGKRFVENVRARGLVHSLKMWSKDRHLDRMYESAHFRFTREVLLHQIEQGDAARFLEMM